MLRLTVLTAVIACCSSFIAPPVVVRAPTCLGSNKDMQLMMTHPEHAADTDEEPFVSGPMDRRTLLKMIPASLVADTDLKSCGSTLALSSPSWARSIFGRGTLGLAVAGSVPEIALARASPKLAPAGTKVVVLGGNGFVGSKVCELLVEAGVSVTSVSRSGAKPDLWAAGQSWVDKVSWTKGDPISEDLSPVFGKASAVISCVGVIGVSDAELEKGNGDVNVNAAAQAAKGDVGRFVYVSVSHLVPEAVGGAVMKGYFAGKSRAEEAIAKSFPSTGVLIKPTFVYGGDSFGLFPPRVSDGYGSGIDALLSSGPIRAIAGVSPGLIKVALSPPVSRENVALACVAGALGRLQGTSFDGADEINAAALKA